MCTFEDMRAGHSGDLQLPSLGVYGEVNFIYVGGMRHANFFDLTT